MYENIPDLIWPFILRGLLVVLNFPMLVQLLIVFNKTIALKINRKCLNMRRHTWWLFSFKGEGGEMCPPDLEYI
jgi:hypothetical protein